MWRQKYLLRRPSQISDGLSSSAPLYRHTIVQPCNKNFDFCSILPNQNTALPPWLQSSDLIGWKMTSTLIFPPGEKSRCQEFRYKDISSIFNKCPDRLITSITAKPYILQNILFHWICSKFFKFQHWHNLFWHPTSWRLLSEAKNTPQRPKMVWRSQFIEKSF